ncbi:MAG: Sigma-70, region 4, partial [Armatimonadetes bacterium]|nr:Sigma-70, region 4 [Armatimonadota bacterium]
LDSLAVPAHDARRTLLAGDDPSLRMAWNAPPQPRRLAEVLEELLELLSRQAQSAERKAAAPRGGRREGAKAPRASLADVVELVFGCLTPREREVVEVRFAPVGDELPGYAEIGRRLGLSRERVRQVVSAALTRIGSDPERQRRRWVTEEIAAAFEGASGILSEAQLQDLLRKRHAGSSSVAAPLVRLLLETSRGYDRVRGRVWCSGIAAESAAASLDRLHELLRRSGRTMAPTQLAVLFRQEPPFGAASDAFIAACLAADSRLSLLDTRRVGLREWRWGVPKTVDEALLACLRDAGQPLSLAQLAARAGAILPRDTPIPPATVQRALDEGPFVQVGPGVYNVHGDP